MSAPQILYELINHFLETYFTTNKKHWKEACVDIISNILFTRDNQGEYLQSFYMELLEEQYVLYDGAEDIQQYDSVQYFFYDIAVDSQVITSLLQSLFEWLFPLTKTYLSPYNTLKNDHIYQSAKKRLNQNTQHYLLDFAEVRADICVEVLARSLDIPLKEINLPEDFVLFQPVRTYENDDLIRNFTTIDFIGPEKREGGYAIIKLESYKIQADLLLQEFLKKQTNGDNYGNWHIISSTEAKQLLRQMAMFVAGSHKIDQRASTKQAKQLTSALMQNIGQGFTYFTNIVDVANPFHQPGKVYYNAPLFSLSKCVAFCAISSKKLIFLQQTWDHFSE